VWPKKIESTNGPIFITLEEVVGICIRLLNEFFLSSLEHLKLLQKQVLSLVWLVFAILDNPFTLGSHFLLCIIQNFLVAHRPVKINM